VEALTRETFWRGFWGKDQKICDEHLLVRKLRSATAFVPELDLIAELDGEIVGHIIYTKGKVVDDSGKEHEVLTFGPLSVLPKYQSLGIGSKLMKHSFEEAYRLGFRAVIIFGYPDYYPRVGFRPAGEFGITTAEGNTSDAFMALPLYPGALDGITGKFYGDSVYEQLTQEEALEFDKRFPEKEAYTPVSIEVLLNQLAPDARKAIEDLGYKTLTVVKAKSERFLRAQPGIDDSAVEVIRALMKENGYAWGE